MRALHLRPGARLALAFSVASLVVACSRRAPVTDDSGAAAMMRNLLCSRGVDVEIAAGAGGPGPEAVADRVSRLSAEAGKDLDLTYRIATSAAGDGERRSRIVVGTSEDPRARSLATRLGLVLGENDRGPFFRWHDQVFDDPRDGLIATFEDPERVGLPLTLYLANTALALPGYLGDLGAGWRPWVRVFSAGELFLSGPLTRTGEVIEPRLEQLALLRQRQLPGFGDLPANELGIVGRASLALAGESVKGYLVFAGEARARIAAWAAPHANAPVLPVLTLFLYSEPEDLAASATADALSAWNPVGNAVHALCTPNLPHDGGTAIARAAAYAWLGEPAEAWLADGAATDAARVWWNMYLERWISWLHRGRLAPSLEEITDARACERFSPHLVVPMRAALFRFLLDTRGDAFMRQLWQGGAELTIDNDLKRSFEAHWTAVDARYRGVFNLRRKDRVAASGAVPFLKGVGLEPPGRAPDRGFGSRRCEQSLAEIRALGANAVAVSSFCVDERDPPRLVGLGAGREFAPLEGDVALYTALTSAKRRGLSTLFSPHLLTAPGGSWNGAWVRSTAAGWQDFFASYERFIVHCALLCELANVDFLSLGSDIPDVVRGTSEGRRARPEEAEEKRAGWSRVIGAARGAFAGRITYSASSSAEAERIAFWDSLDAVGFEIFYPERAPSKDDPQDPRGYLLWNIDHDLGEVEKVAEAHAKPLIVTEVGFIAGSSTSAGFPRNGPGSVDVDQQADSYAMLESALAPFAARKHLKGVFVWRWSTDPGDPGVNARDYLFKHRPAMGVVRRMFSQL